MQIPSRVSAVIACVASPLAEAFEHHPERKVEEALNAVAHQEHEIARTDLERRDEAFEDQRRENELRLRAIQG